MKPVKTIKAVILALLLSACTQINTAPIVEQESLLQQCSYDTPIPKDTTGKALMKALIDYQHIYNDCASRNDALIKLIKGLRDYDKKV